MNGNYNYQELSNTENDNQDLDLVSTNIEENSFNWSNIIMEICISIIIAFCIFYIILEVHEVYNTKDPKFEQFNNSIETVYLLIVSFGIGLYIMMYRWHRNCWYSVPFENYPMIIMLCIYGLIELIYYFLIFISSILKYLSLSLTGKRFTFRILAIAGEFIFMVTLLPFLMISIRNNVRRNHNWIKLSTKIVIILSMVGCLLMFTRKTALKIIKDYRIIVNITSPENSTFQDLQKVCSRAVDLLEIFDINYFIIVFIFLINPLFYLKENEKTTINNNTSLENSSSKTISIMYWISFVRFRLWSIFISIGFITIIGVALYISSSLPSEIKFQFIQITFLTLVSIAYLITIIYGLVYHFNYINTWEIKENQNHNTDQYFNFITSLAQLVYSSSMLINLVILKYDINHLIQIINYFLLAIQILVQANCINSASKRSIRKFSRDEFSSWKFKLFPPVVLSSLNCISMVISFAYIVKPAYSLNMFKNNSGKFMWLIIKDLTLPLTILNRFHGMSFFINLTVKQWD